MGVTERMIRKLVETRQLASVKVGGSCGSSRAQYRIHRKTPAARSQMMPISRIGRRAVSNRALSQPRCYSLRHRRYYPKNDVYQTNLLVQ